jgi:hypothetical protein
MYVYVCVYVCMYVRMYVYDVCMNVCCVCVFIGGGIRHDRTL